MALTTKRPIKENPENQTKLSDFQTDTSKVVRMNVNLTEQQRLKLKRYALDNDKTMTEVIINFIDRLDER